MPLPLARLWVRCENPIGLVITDKDYLQETYSYLTTCCELMWKLTASITIQTHQKIQNPKMPLFSNVKRTLLPDNFWYDQHWMSYIVRVNIVVLLEIFLAQVQVQSYNNNKMKLALIFVLDFLLIFSSEWLQQEWAVFARLVISCTVEYKHLTICIVYSVVQLGPNPFYLTSKPNLHLDCKVLGLVRAKVCSQYKKLD